MSIASKVTKSSKPRSSVRSKANPQVIGHSESQQGNSAKTSLSDIKERAPRPRSKISKKPISKPLWAHQKKTAKLCKKSNIIFDTSDPGCVSADTEYLTPTGWKRIDEYVKGDKVAQFHPTDRSIEFIKPIAYIKRPCSRMIAIAPCRGTSQRLSHEHRVLYYNPNGTHGVCSAAEFMEALHAKGAAHFKRKFATTFNLISKDYIELTTAQIRVMVAVIADGSFPSSTTRCNIRIKKERKKARLRALLKVANLEYKERACTIEGFTIFTFYAPRRDKIFTEYYWKSSPVQLNTIADELPHWDGSIRKTGSVCFSTSEIETADFAQYAFAASGQTASLGFQDRTHDTLRNRRVEYTVNAVSYSRDVGPGRHTSVYETDNPEGFKYCFEVPSTFLLLRHNGHIFATGNTGKTRAHLEAFAKRRRKGGGCLLVIAPKSLLETAWQDDAAEFVPDMNSVAAYVENREEAFQLNLDIYIVNTDAVRWLVKQPKKFFKKFDSIIIDESTTFKHRTSQRSKALIKLKEHFTYRAMLTGTPNSKSITDIWNQLFFLDDGIRLGANFFRFRLAVCEPRQIGPKANMIQWEDKEDAEISVAALIKDITIRHEFDKCMDIPPNHTYTVTHTLPLKLKRQYDKLANDARLLLVNDEVSAINAAALRTKLLQTASGAVYSEGGTAVLDTSRYELICDLIEQRKHSITFFVWKHQREQLIAMANKRGITHAVLDGDTPKHRRKAIVSAYQAGHYQTLFLHPKTGAHGLTLTKGTATIWASPIYEPDFLKQGIHRIWRGGQTLPTETILIEAADTCEDKVFASLNGKQKRMMNLLEMLSL